MLFLLIGLVGMVLDQILAYCAFQAIVTFPECSAWRKISSRSRPSPSATRPRRHHRDLRESLAADERGEFVCVIGHSGCGKTTVLNMLAGLDRPSDGAVIVDGQAIEGPSLDRAVIFQGHSLLPWRSVMGNVAYAVTSKWRNWARAKVKARAEIHRPRRPLPAPSTSAPPNSPAA